jgi:hypothetical protein
MNAFKLRRFHALVILLGSVALRAGRLADGFLERPLPDVCVQAPPRIIL